MQTGDHFHGIWSLCWSADSREVIAGTGLPGLVSYDIQRETLKSKVYCHEDDVNAVTFLGEDCNAIVTGSDDSNIFVHDRYACAIFCALLFFFALNGCALQGASQGLFL
jgi:WD repeat-containing protein 23